MKDRLTDTIIITTTAAQYTYRNAFIHTDDCFLQVRNHDKILAAFPASVLISAEVQNEATEHVENVYVQTNDELKKRSARGGGFASIRE